MEQTERLIRELKNKALAELNELKQKTAVERKTMEQAKIAASSFKADLFELYRMHLDSINRIPDLSETDYVPETLPELESPQPEEAAETASPEENPADAAAQSALKESEDSETEDPFAQLEETGDSDSAASEETAQSEESSEASKEPEQLKWGAFEQDTKTFEEEPKVQPQQETAGDTTVIPTQKIDGDATPEDVRRTMQNTSKPVYGRKFTDLKFGSGK